MQDQSDAQLLRAYARGNDAAFREIVTRHADLVYASALRQARSPELARDIAQTVFSDLVRKAPALAQSLPATASLVGWLYRSTRFEAHTQMRDERRRQARERQAMQEFDPTPETASAWERVGPVLDEAMADLNDEDRDALLLRFFKNHDFRTIGAALGVSDDTAQKRVSRALDRLRAEFNRRGVTTSAVALTAALSANAVAAGPAGLAATLSTAALTSSPLAATATATATKAIAMTTLQKTIIGATLAVAVGTGVYQAREVAQLRSQNQTLQQQQAPLAEQIQQLGQALLKATNQLAALQRDNERLNRNTAEVLKLRAEVAKSRDEARTAVKAFEDIAATDNAAKTWLARVVDLKRRFEQSSEARIPELQYVAEEDWLNVARRELNTEKDYRDAMSRVRSAGVQKFLKMLQPALKAYLKANGEFPTALSQLQPFLESPVEDAILQRYEIIPTQNFMEAAVWGKWSIGEKAPIDAEFDHRWLLWRTGPNTGTGLSTSGWDRRSEESPLGPAVGVLLPLIDNYKAAHNGSEPTEPSQLQPYVKTPAQEAAFQLIMQEAKKQNESKRK